MEPFPNCTWLYSHRTLRLCANGEPDGATVLGGQQRRCERRQSDARAQHGLSLMSGAREGVEASERCQRSAEGPPHGGAVRREANREVPKRVICYNCGAPCWTSNDTWLKCDICGKRVWIDFNHPEAPSKWAIREVLR